MRRIVHFGPSKSTQIMCRNVVGAGRDNLPRTCILLYNGLLSANCDKDIELQKVDGCRRQFLMKHFGFQVEQMISRSHKCCDVCAANCQCQEDSCKDKWSLHVENDDLPEPEIGLPFDTANNQLRNVSKEEMNILQVKLLKFQQDLVLQVETKTMLSCFNVLLEFNAFYINQVLKKCHQLFTMKDILHHVEIWRYKYARAIMSDTFGDERQESPPTEDCNSSQDFSIRSDWEQVKDD